MAAINQRIPNFLGGVSQQPDFIKFPGQLRTCHNAHPDVTFGLQKRPPGEFVGILDGAADSGEWIEILRDDDEKFLVQISEKTNTTTTGPILKVWALKDIPAGVYGASAIPAGTEMTVTSGYPIVWTATTQAPDGTVVKASDDEDRTLIYEATNTGTTGSTEPTWPTVIGGTVVDGTITWKAVAKFDYLTRNTTGSDSDRPYGSLTITDYTLIANPEKTVEKDRKTAKFKDNYAFVTLNEIAYNTEYVISLDNPTLTGTTKYRAESLEISDIPIRPTDSRYTSTTEYGTSTFSTASPDSGLVGKFVFFGDSSDYGDEADTVWTATTAKEIEQPGRTSSVSTASYVRPVGSDVSTPLIFQCTTAGTTGSGEPTWPTTAGDTVTDGTVTWTAVKNVSWEDVKFTVTVNATHFLHSGTSDYDTQYTGAVTLQDPGKNIREGSYKDVAVNGVNYRVIIRSASSYESYADAEAAIYESPLNIKKGEISIDSTIGNLKRALEVCYSNQHGAATVKDFGLTAEATGNGLYIETTIPFDTIAVRGGMTGDSLYAFTTTTQNISKLPGSCKDGYIVQVSNTEDSEADDYYVQFVTASTTVGSVGQGIWEEVVGPDIDAGFKYTTMPHALINKRDGTFQWTPLVYQPKVDTIVVNTNGTSGGVDGTVSNKNATVNTGNGWGLRVDLTISGGVCTAITPSSVAGNWPAGGYQFESGDTITISAADAGTTTDVTATIETLGDNFFDSTGDNYWVDRLVGDDNTNPMPTFVGQKISQFFFTRNRLGVVSGEQVVISQPADYFNFFVNSAISASDADPIDMGASDVKPAILRHAVPMQKGVILFSEAAQFMLFTESEEFSPKTAQLKKLSSYECSKNLDPVDTGTSIMFGTNLASYSKIFELIVQADNQPPKVIEQTRTVPEYVPNTTNTVASSPVNGLITYGTIGASNIYTYKYFDGGDKREQSSWYSWDIEGELIHHLYSGGDYYTVTKQGTQKVLQRYEMTVSAGDTRSYSVGQGIVGLPTTVSRRFEACLDNMVDTSQTTVTYLNGNSTVELPYDVVGSTASNEMQLVDLVTGVILEPDSIGTGADAHKATFNGVELRYKHKTDLTSGGVKTISVTGDGTGGGTNGVLECLPHKSTTGGGILSTPGGSHTTVSFGSALEVNAAIDANGTCISLSVAQPGIAYEVGDTITIDKALTGTTTDVVGTITEVEGVPTIPNPGYNAAHSPQTNAEKISLYGATVFVDNDGNTVGTYNLNQTIQGNTVVNSAWGETPTPITGKTIGDLVATPFAIGYKYTTEIGLPTYYLAVDRGAYDVDADLRIHRVNFELGVSGPMEFHLESPQRDSYIHEESGLVAGLSTLSKVPSQLYKSVSIPIYNKNSKYDLTIKIPDPFTATIVSGSWDGSFQTRRHARR